MSVDFDKVTPMAANNAFGSNWGRAETDAARSIQSL
jgi:hypothetical protein